MWWTHLLPRIAELVALGVLGAAVAQRLPLLVAWVGCVVLVALYPQRPYASIAILILQYASRRTMFTVLTVVELLFLVGRAHRWPFKFPDASEPALRVVDEQRGVVYEQITTTTLAEVGAFWSRHAPHREPCARHLFQPHIRADPASAARIERELDAGFPHFFNIQAKQRLGWFARSIATNQVVAYRFAVDYATVMWYEASNHKHTQHAFFARQSRLTLLRGAGHSRTLSCIGACGTLSLALACYRRG